MGRSGHRAALARVPVFAHLEGIPLGIKDLFCTKGVQTTAGSRILEGYRCAYASSSSQAEGFAAQFLSIPRINQLLVIADSVAGR